jgi:ABC-2 type transport system ATP-binding protein
MNKADVPELTTGLVSAGIQLLSVQPRHSLEDYFLSLTTPEQHVEAIAD